MAQSIIPPTSDPFREDEEEGIDIKQYLFLFLKNWYWLIFGLGLGLIGAWLVLRYSTTVYNIKSSILINEQQQQGYLLSQGKDRSVAQQLFAQRLDHSG